MDGGSTRRQCREEQGSMRNALVPRDAMGSGDDRWRRHGPENTPSGSVRMKMRPRIVSFPTLGFNRPLDLASPAAETWEIHDFTTDR